MPAARAIIEHRLPSRLRLRVPARRGSTTYFERLVACLAEQPDVEEVSADPRTAGVLVLHRGDERAILGAAGERGLIVLEPGQDQPEAPGPADGRPSVNALLAGLLAVLGCVQLLRGRTLGPASELMWNAYALAGLMRGGPGLPLIGAAILVKLVQGPVLGSASSLFFYALAAQKMAQQEKQAAASGSASSM